MLLGTASHPGELLEYRVSWARCSVPPGEKPSFVLRTFERDGEPAALVLDAESLVTRIVPLRGLTLTALEWKAMRKAVKGTPYGKALADCEKNANRRQDAGIVRGLPGARGVVLTVDLCPSTRPLDRGLFRAILQNFLAEEKPVPMGIAITGRWMEEHPEDLAWIRELEAAGEIAITWINHSYNHRYNKDLPLSRNFLLEAGTDPDVEVLGTEKAMIQRGLCPSAFFRFPGLVSDASLVRRIVAYGLIPVGSDAWLAKGQRASSGSIVLLHGNGNEPVGISDFLALLKREQGAIRQKNWLLFDLRESVAREEEHK